MNIQSNSDPSAVSILGTRVHRVVLSQALSAIEAMIRSRKNHYIVTPNPEFVMYGAKHKWFRDIVNGASLSIADGVGLLWAAKYLSLGLTPLQPFRFIQDIFQFLWTATCVVLYPKALNVIPERLTGTDMIWEIAKIASERSWRIFLLGAGPGVAMKAAQVMQTLYPRLNVVEIMVGESYESDVKIIRAIQQTKPQIIFLAYSAEKQMRFIKEMLPELSDVIVMGVGGGLDFIVNATAIDSGASDSPAVRAPKWMRTHGLEWLWRLYTQPWRRNRVKTATWDFMMAVRRDRLSGGGLAGERVSG